MLKAAYYNLVAAALTAPVAIASALTAWQSQLEGANLKETCSRMWSSRYQPAE